MTDNPYIDGLRLARPRIVAYAVAVLAVLTVAAAKWTLYRWIQADAPFLMFLAAIMAAAWFGGLGPGLLATALAVALSNLYMHPIGKFDVSDRQQLVRMALFAVEGILVSVLCANLHSARESIERAARQALQLERQILELSDEEQRRIGHDLHDGLGQQLTGLSFIAKRLEQRLAAAGSGEADSARRLSELARHAVSWTHDLSHALIPPALKKEGLAPALQELAANASSLFEVNCRFETGDSVPDIRDVSTGVHLYRIAQEAVTNAIKHGRATEVMIRMTADARGAVTVSVEDSGPAARAGRTHADPAEGRLGRMIMDYRARMIGASLAVTRASAGGTIVSCAINPSSEPNHA